MPPPGTGASPAPSGPCPEAVAELEANGLLHDHAVRVLKVCNDDIDEAMDFITKVSHASNTAFSSMMTADEMYVAVQG